MDERRKDLCYYRLEKSKKCLASAKLLIQAFEIRSESDYDDYYVLSREDVEEQVQNAQFFLDGIMKYVDGMFK